MLFLLRVARENRVLHYDSTDTGDDVIKGWLRLFSLLFTYKNSVRFNISYQGSRTVGDSPDMKLCLSCMTKNDALN